MATVTVTPLMLTTGSIKVQLDDGEVFKGQWRMIPVGGAATTAADTSPPPDLSPDWDYVYGPGYYRAHILGSGDQSRALLTGSAGGTAVVEFIDAHGPCGVAKGVARDSHDNVYKVTFQVTCAAGAAGLTGGDSTTTTEDMGPRLVVPATGGPPVMATPVGGGMYVPVTGGPPIPGTPQR
jgi:hypothetical protein